MDLTVYNELKQLIEAMTCTGAPSLDQGHLKRVKQICKSSNMYVERAFDLLMIQLAKPHSEIRLSAFQISNELFIRSHVFRELLVSRFQQLLEVTIETDADQPLPPPYSAANQLKQQSLFAIRQWHDRFGPSYPKLRLGYEFLKFNKKVNFDDLIAQSESQRRRQEVKETRTRLLREQQLETVQKEINDNIPDINQCLAEIDTCFNLLLPRMDTWNNEYFNIDAIDTTPDSSYPNAVVGDHDNKDTQSDSDDEEWVEVDRPSSSCGLEGHGISGREFNLTITLPKGKKSLLIEETEDNQSIFENMRGCHALCTNTHLPMVNKWLQLLTICGKDEQLKQVIELKQKLLLAKEKYEELKIVSSTKQSNGGIVNEQFPGSSKGKSGTMKNVPVKFSMEMGVRKKGATNTSVDPTSLQAQLLVKQQKQSLTEGSVAKDDGKRTQRNVPVSDHKAHLLSRAPVVPYDTDLYDWETPNCIPNEIQFESLHKFWAGSKETEVIISEERKAIMSNRKITFEGTFQPVKWTCRAPLPSGKLCPRRDRVKCPLHGVIVARDEQGRPVNSSENDTASAPSTSTDLSWQDIEEEVSIATGHMMEEKDKKKNRKRKENPMGGLTDIKAKKISARVRLEKKILNKRSLRRIADAMDTIDEKRHHQKFSSSFKYALSK